MASSNPNRHWPSMFRSKTCNSLHHHHQWKHDNINSSFISPSSFHRTTHASGVEEERSAEPKPRWNPKPEQIRILEAIFNSGMVNPPRDEIRKIRAQLQEYGQVGDANVFYWFQNRKSRSKHKLRHLHNSSNALQTQNSNNSSSKEIIIPPNKPSLVSNIVFSDVSSDIVVPISSAPPPPPPQPFFFIPVHQQNVGAGGVAKNVVPVHVPFSQGFYFSELSNVVPPEAPRDLHHHQQINAGSCTSLLLNEIMNIHSPSENEQDKVMQMQQHPPITRTTVPPATTTTVTVPSPIISQIQDVGEAPVTEEGPPGGSMKSTVFINDVAFEVGVGPLNVRGAFGDDAVLIHGSGQPVLIDEWGVTLQPLHHGAFYYLIYKEEISGGGRNGI